MNARRQESLGGKRIAAYARFSCDKQNERSADDQLARCIERVESAGGGVPEQLLLKDVATSGASTARPAFERLMSLVRARQLDVIVAEDMDRVSRDLADSAFLIKELAFYDVELITVSDGMSSLAPSAKTHFLLKGFMGEAFLDNLRDKTLRGQMACFKAGFATGAVAYGFHTTPKINASGEVVAHVIHVYEEQAEIVRRIFAEYLAGRSLALITAGLNADDVQPPRSMRRKGAPAWGDSSVRSILHNAVYAGIWKFGLKKWEKIPGTNKRQPKKRNPNEVPPEQHRPHLQIIDDATWQAVQDRLAVVRSHYVKADKKTGLSFQGKNTSYLLSGLLVCQCGALMFINGGSHRRYRCTANARRGTCPNRVTVPEQIARKRIVEGVREVLLNDFAVAYAEKLAQRGSGSRLTDTEKALTAKRGELVKAEVRIRKLVEKMADDDAADYVREMMNELARKAKQLKQEIAVLESVATTPVKPVKQEDIRDRVERLQAFFDGNVLAGREYLRKLLRGQTITLLVQPDGFYKAHTRLLPMVLLTEPPPPVDPEGAVSSRSCGGRI